VDPSILSDDPLEGPAWTRRSSEPPVDPKSNLIKIAAFTVLAMLIIAGGIWFFVIAPNTARESANNGPVANGPVEPRPYSKSNGDVPPARRTIEPPPGATAFQCTRTDLKGDLYRNFLAFSVFYPKDWKMSGPQESKDDKIRGKFLDIAGNTPDGKLKEQMLVSYYPSSGTYSEDSSKFPEMVKETNETLNKLIRNYQMVSEGETTLNDSWRAYEIKFQGSSSGENGQRVIVWGRRLFVPVARPGVRAGFEITMLATNNSDQVHSVDEVGSKGDLKSVLSTFEPGSNF
jgi:hypothetical protein